MPAPEPDQLRTQLQSALGAALGDGYVVERALGEGGFAVVFLVKDLGLKRDLAVKVLSPDMIASQTALERFRREAETVARLSHPNIVPLHFIGQKDDLVYLAMQCVDGGSIADRLEREGRLPVADAVRITLEVASALAHAHRHGVVHRDIKPANVLVDAETDRCLVTDFGIARTAEGGSLTATGLVLGTPAYLAPEQVTGGLADHRADIFALGVMAYEMLAGRLPYEGATPTAAMMRRLAGPPALVTTVRPEVPEEVARVVAGCLATEPDERIQNAADVVRALGGQTPASGSRHPAAVPHVALPTGGAARRRGPGRSVALGAGAVALIALGGWWLAQRRPSAPAAPAATTAPASAPPGPAALDSGMVRIPGGDYVIGTDGGSYALDRPRHTARVDAFAIGRTEVTVGAFAEYVRAARAPAPWGTGPMPDPRLPVTRVPLGEAANYCAWRHGPQGRLPTEVEWEAAARGPAGRDYPWGQSAEIARANTKSLGRTGPAPVGSFPLGATPEGAQDMIGNVWEWTRTPLHAYPGAAALPDSMASYYVIRGGHYETDDALATPWRRGYLKPSTPRADLKATGFRCAPSIPAEGAPRP